MTDLEFAQLRWDIEKAVENVEILQREYETVLSGA